MTIKKEDEVKQEKDNKKAKPAEEKLTLYEAVEANTSPLFIIMGALSYAGLIKQYEAEKAVYGIEDIKPSITKTELDKLIKKFTGE